MGQFGGLAPAIEQMTDGQPGVAQQHAGATPAHHLLDLFAHRRCVAVDVAVGAGGLVTVAVTAAGEPLVGEIPQLATVTAVGILMVVQAVEADHGTDCPLLAHQSGVNRRRFAGAGVRAPCWVGLMNFHGRHFPDQPWRGVDMSQKCGQMTIYRGLAGHFFASFV